MTRPIYMDNHSTTRCDPRVVDAMVPFFGERYGNAASRTHRFGWELESVVEDARRQVGALIGAATPREVVWTSGATESDNLAIKGVAHAYRDRGDHVVTSRVEHKAVIDTCRRLEREGVRVTWLAPTPDGRVDPEAVAAAIDDRTVLVSVMLANNEVGAVSDIAAIGGITRERGVLFHCDAAQGAGLCDLDVERANVDLVSLSAHKMYGPKGVGALWVRRQNPRVKLVAEIDGGGHERGMRSGTINVPGVVGFGEAARIMKEEGAELAARERALTARLFAHFEGALGGVHLNGPSPPHRHPGNLNVSFDEVDAEALMLALKDVVAVSSGSACTSASVEPSYVLRAMGVDEDRAHASIRFGLGGFNTDEEVDVVGARVVEEVKRQRRGTPPRSP